MIATQWHGISITPEEWTRWRTGKEKPEQTLNGILESGLPLKDRIISGQTLSPADARLANRVSEVLIAAKQYGLIFAFCSTELLQAFDFNPA